MLAARARPCFIGPAGRIQRLRPPLQIVPCRDEAWTGHAARKQGIHDLQLPFFLTANTAKLRHRLQRPPDRPKRLRRLSCVSFDQSGRFSVSTLAAPIANLFEAGVEADRGLVQRAKLGDEHAFFGLYEMHGRGIYSWSLKAAESVAAAEDLTRLVFLEAFTNL